MAQTVSVRLEIDEDYIDLNEHGLLNMTFDRFSASDTSGILSELDLIMYDKTGSTLLPLILHNVDGQLRLQYGFVGDTKETTLLSEVYVLNILKIKPRWTNRASTLSIGAIATQVAKPPLARYYKAGTSIEAIVKDIAKYNEWYMGPEDANVEAKGEIPVDLYKDPAKSDFTFIKETLIPIVEAQYITVEKVTFYDCRLVGTALGRPELFFRPKTPDKKRKVWSYSIGTSTDSKVISVDADIDLSFLIKGLTIEIPATTLDYAILSETELEDKLTTIYENQKRYIEESLDKYNIPLMLPSKLKFNTKIMPPEGDEDDEGTIALKIEDRILTAITNAMKTISTMKLTVVGNPHIMPNDLIELNILNIDGTHHILSSGASNSFWEVIKISEQIGLDGYKTELTLARAIVEQAMEV